MLALLLALALLLPTPSGCATQLTTLHEDQVPGLVQYEPIGGGHALAVTCNGGR